MTPFQKATPKTQPVQEGPACQDRNDSRKHERFTLKNHPTHWLDRNLFQHLSEQSTTAFRIADTLDFSIDRFGESLLVSSRQSDANWTTPLEKWTSDTGWSPSRIFLRQLVRSPGEKDTPTLIEGDPAQPPQEIVLESGLHYEVDFHTGYNPGLFCDQRANRDFLRTRAPRRVLNTFAHTGAFSVAAASVGAETVSVDISKSSLQRARRNFELNTIPTTNHRFLVEDVPTYLRRLAKRGETFDAIILDPPTFGRGGAGKSFRVERDFQPLLASALDLAAPRAAILLSTNFSEWSPEHLAEEASRLAPTATFQKIPPPPDFFDRPPSSTIWMLLEIP